MSRICNKHNEKSIHFDLFDWYYLRKCSVHFICEKPWIVIIIVDINNDIMNQCGYEEWHNSSGWTPFNKKIKKE